MTYVETLGANAKTAERAIAAASAKQKNNALTAIAEALVNNTDSIIEANRADLDNAVKNNMSASMQDRLKLTADRIKGIASSVLDIVKLDDPVGYVESGSIRPNGIKIQKTRVPLGTIGIIYESRPNVTVDAAVLCIKAGNAVILRGGKEAYH
jgi:glutamate-5-semialdehyde dehydrogenase